MEKKLIDDCFYVEHKSWGTWQSHHPDGKGIVTSLTEEECIRATRFMLKVRQEKSYEDIKTYSGEVTGKL